MEHSQPRSGWAIFFNKPAVWKAFLIAFGYLVIFLATGTLSARLFGANLDLAHVTVTPQGILIGLLIPTAIGSLLLILFGQSIGWLRPVFAAQPIKGKRWMWIAPALVILSIVLRLVGADYSAYPIASIVLLFITGIFIGISEELVTRGYAVKMLRDAGKSERTVMVLSSLIFGLLHSTNILGGQSIGITLIQVLFTFGFGICMYLTLRATGNLLYPIIIHGLYDPSGIISSGGINNVSSGGSANPLAALSGSFTLIFLLFAVIAIIFVHDRVNE